MLAATVEARGAAEVVAVVDCAPEDEPLLERLRREAPTRVSFGPASADEIAARADGAEVLVTLYTYTQVDAAVLERLPRLRLVATRTAGYSHIDVEAATARGIAVAIVPAATTQSVAEFTFGAVIALQRRLFRGAGIERGGSWEYRSFRGFELAGKTLGVVGLGRIGVRVAELGSAFGMRVLGWSRSEREIPGVERARPGGAAAARRRRDRQRRAHRRDARPARRRAPRLAEAVGDPRQHCARRHRRRRGSAPPARGGTARRRRSRRASSGAARRGASSGSQAPRTSSSRRTSPGTRTRPSPASSRRPPTTCWRSSRAPLATSSRASRSSSSGKGGTDGTA